jgi:UDP-glucose 4-epimerase
VLESIRDRTEFVLNGIDYPTPDGTCVRDYVHVEDIARAHVMALDSKVTAGVYNLGSNNGTSNREIIDTVQQVTGSAAVVQLGQARPGDPPILTASAAKFGMVVGDAWQKHTLHDMISHAWTWYNQ